MSTSGHRSKRIGVRAAVAFAIFGGFLSALAPGARLAALFSSASPPPRLMENLRRGIVAVRTGETDVYVGWRLLARCQDVLRVTLQPKLTGRVTDASTGKGVGAARLALGDLVLGTDSDGAYELKRRPSTGSRKRPAR